MTEHRPLPRAARRPPEFDPRDLVATYVTNHADIEFAERANVAAAARWAFGRRKVTTPANLLTTDFADRVHRRMFGDVWTWAGHRRTAPDGDGVAPDLIESRLSEVFDCVRSWHHTGHLDPEGRAVHLHDELIRIRAYRHGNVRHARLVADLYLHLVDEPRLTWTRLRPHDPHTGDDEVSALQRALDAAVRDTDPGQLKSALDRALESPR